MNAVRIVGEALLAVGILSAIFGLWCAVGGLRAVVSNRTDEKRQGSRSARFAALYIVAGLILSLGGLWLAGWAAT
ncbi:MAG TPA: hypothetical protein VHU84_03635 [Lacipirellulaceae bacterium]|jgi:uncharacterized membrane protein YiaA|nr:hypothetical protein [Lacipirellulaceae bacterium]